MVEPTADEQHSHDPVSEHSPIGPAVETIITVAAPIALVLDADDNNEENILSEDRPSLPTTVALDTADNGHRASTFEHRPHFLLNENNCEESHSWADFPDDEDLGEVPVFQSSMKPSALKTDDHSSNVKPNVISASGISDEPYPWYHDDDSHDTVSKADSAEIDELTQGLLSSWHNEKRHTQLQRLNKLLQKYCNDSCQIITEQLNELTALHACVKELEQMVTKTHAQPLKSELDTDATTRRHVSRLVSSGPGPVVNSRYQYTSSVLPKVSSLK